MGSAGGPAAPAVIRIGTEVDAQVAALVGRATSAFGRALAGHAELSFAALVVAGAAVGTVLADVDALTGTRAARRSLTLVRAGAAGTCRIIVLLR